MRYPPEQQEMARKLRAQGRTLGQIAYYLNVPKRTVHRWVDDEARERAIAYGRAYRERNRDRLNRYARRYMLRQRKGKCPVCRQPVPKPGIKRCSRCRDEDREWLWREIQGHWSKGLKLREIAEEVGLPLQSVSSHVRRMRKAGWDVPRRRA